MEEESSTVCKWDVWSTGAGLNANVTVPVLVGFRLK
jgi:hypothetical protein